MKQTYEKSDRTSQSLITLTRFCASLPCLPLDIAYDNHRLLETKKKKRKKSYKTYKQTKGEHQVK